jgi:hypothetical protein
MSVSQAQEKIDSAEFSEWAAFSRIEPFNQDTTNHLLAYILTVLSNTLKKPGTRTFAPADFLPGRKVAKRDTSTEMQTKLKAMFPNGSN